MSCQLFYSMQVRFLKENVLFSVCMDVPLVGESKKPFLDCFLERTKKEENILIPGESWIQEKQLGMSEFPHLTIMKAMSWWGFVRKQDEGKRGEGGTVSVERNHVQGKKSALVRVLIPRKNRYLSVRKNKNKAMVKCIFFAKEYRNKAA